MRSGMRLSWYTIVGVLLIGAMTVTAQMPVIVESANGAQIRQIRSLAVGDNLVAASRQGMFGADSAATVLARAEGIAGEDREADLVLLRVSGARSVIRFQAKELETGQVLSGGGFLTVVERMSEIPGFGVVYQLRHNRTNATEAGFLWNEKGEVAAWYIPKTVDGQRFSFAVPVSRLLCLAPHRVVPIRKWAGSNRQEASQSLALALGYFWLGDYDGATYHLRSYTQKYPEEARGWFYLAFAEGKMGRAARKVAAYRKAVELAPAWGEPRYNLGLSLLLEGDLVEAREEAAALEEVDPVAGRRLLAYIHMVHIDPFPREGATMPNPVPVSPPKVPR